MSALNASMTRAGRLCLAGRRAGGLVVPLLVAGALAAGCGSATPVAPASPVPTVSGGPVVAGGAACAGWPANATPAPLPVSFVPVSVERCVDGVQAIPGKGRWTTATLQRSTGDLAGLVAALRRPDAARKPGTICPALAIAPPQVVLIDAAGEKLVPRFPVDDCGIIAPAALTALSQLSWQPLSIRLIAPVPGSTATTPTGSGTAPHSTPTPGGVMQPG